MTVSLTVCHLLPSFLIISRRRNCKAQFLFLLPFPSKSLEVSGDEIRYQVNQINFDAANIDVRVTGFSNTFWAFFFTTLRLPNVRFSGGLILVPLPSRETSESSAFQTCDKNWSTYSCSYTAGLLERSAKISRHSGKTDHKKSIAMPANGLG